MMPLVNKHVENLDDEMQESEEFKPQYVDQIFTSKDSILNEMCDIADCDDYQPSNVPSEEEVRVVE